MKNGFLQSVIKHEVRPLPQPTGDATFRLSLDEVLSSKEIQSIIDDERITFHCIVGT